MISLTKKQKEACDTLGFVPERGGWRVGPHVVLVGDMQDEDHLDYLLSFGPWDICWTDPPWTNATATHFRKVAGVEGDPQIDRMYEHLGEALGWVKHAALVWTNDFTRPHAIAALHLGGFDHSREFYATYKGFEHPTPLTVAWRRHVDAGKLEIDGHRGGRAVIRAFVDWYGPGRLVDPFCGQEVMASAAGNGTIVTGSEIHAGRAAVTLARLAKIEKRTPVRL